MTLTAAQIMAAFRAVAARYSRCTQRTLMVEACEDLGVTQGSEDWGLVVAHLDDFLGAETVSAGHSLHEIDSVPGARGAALYSLRPEALDPTWPAKQEIRRLEKALMLAGQVYGGTPQLIPELEAKLAEAKANVEVAR